MSHTRREVTVGLMALDKEHFVIVRASSMEPAIEARVDIPIAQWDDLVAQVGRLRVGWETPHA